MKTKKSRKMRDIEWFKRKFQSMKELYKKIEDICPEICYETKGCWSLLKLGILSNYVNQYTMVIRPNMEKMQVNELVYIDLLAGSGVTYISSRDLYLPGSTLIAVDFPEYKKFDKIISVEKDLRYCKALEERVEKIIDHKEQEHISIYGDCNEKIDEVIGELTEKSHYLLFVDNEGLNTHFSSMIKLLDYRGDVFINFPSGPMGRVFGHGKRGRSQEATLDKFFGDRETWITKNKVIELLEAYKNKVSFYKGKYAQEGREVTLHIPIYGGKNFEKYALIFATRKTTGNSEYVENLLRLKERAENLKNDIIELFVRIFKGEQKTLSSFSSPPAKSEKLF